MRASGYGFASIPDGANVVGIVLSILKSRIGPGNAFDSVVRLVDPSGFVSPHNKARPEAWPTNASVAYGAVNDTWGRSWTGADVKSANFGWVLVANIVRNDSLFTDFSARVNCATVQVCYVP